MSTNTAPANIYDEGADVAKSYGASFGNIPDGTLLCDRLGIHGQPRDDTKHVAKSWEEEYRTVEEITLDGGTFSDGISAIAVEKGLTTGDVSLPVHAQEDLAHLTVRRTPFAAALPRVTAHTDTIAQDSVTEVATPEIGGDTHVPADQNDPTEGQLLPMTYYRVRGSITGPVELASGTLRAFAGEQYSKELAMAQFEEDLALNGSPTDGDTSRGLTDNRAYKGVLTLASENGAVSDASVDTPDTTMTLQNARYVMEQAAGGEGGDPASLINVTDYSTLQTLKNSLDVTYPVEVAGPSGSIDLGARGVLVDGVPTVVSDFMPANTFASVDLRYHLFHNLADLVMEPLAKQADKDEFFLKRYQVMEQSAGAHQFTHVIENLSAA